MITDVSLEGQIEELETVLHEWGSRFSETVDPEFTDFADVCLQIAVDLWPIKTGDSRDAWTSEIKGTGTNKVVEITNAVRDRDYGKPYAAYVRRRGRTPARILSQYTGQMQGPRKATGAYGSGAYPLGSVVWGEKFDEMVAEALPDLLQSCLDKLISNLGG